jgi:hypothetical protein
MSKATQRFWSAAPPAPQSPFSRRLIIQQLMPLQPFFFNDMMFLGLVKDLRKLVTFDLWYELEHCLLNPEQIFHLQPHRGTAHATSMFLRVNPGIECNDLDRSRAMYKLLLENELYLRAIYESLSAFEQGYLMGWEEKEKWQGEDLSLYELLEKPLEDGSHYLWMAGASKNLTTNHAQVVSYLLDRPISPIDRRTLRRLGGTALPDERVLGEQATVLVRKFTRAFPDHPNPPRFPFDDGPLHIIPPRPQTVVPN